MPDLIEVNPNWSKRRALLHGLRRILEQEWVPHTPTGPNQVCMIADHEAVGGVLIDLESPANDALRRACGRKGFANILTFNDSQTSRWPVVGRFLSALVRG